MRDLIMRDTRAEVLMWLLKVGEASFRWYISWKNGLRRKLLN